VKCAPQTFLLSQNLPLSHFSFSLHTTHQTGNTQRSSKSRESGTCDPISGLLVLGHVPMQMYVSTDLCHTPRPSKIYAEYASIIAMKFFDKCCQLRESLTGNGFPKKHRKWKEVEKWAHISIPIRIRTADDVGLPWGFGLKCSSFILTPRESRKPRAQM